MNEEMYPQICYDTDHDIMYVICKRAPAEAENVAKGIYIRHEMKSPYEVAGVIIEDFTKKLEDAGKISDGYHTFDELYHHRMILFSIICNTYKDKAWKSWLHSDGTMFQDYFIVGITTPEGAYSYHYHKDYWDKFSVQELKNAPVWDGHKPEDIERLLSLLEGR